MDGWLKPAPWPRLDGFVLCTDMLNVCHLCPVPTSPCNLPFPGYRRNAILPSSS